MKKIIISIITVLLFTIGLTGCGNSGSTNNLGPQLSSLASVKVSLTENGKAVEAPDSIIASVGFSDITGSEFSLYQDHIL